MIALVRGLTYAALFIGGLLVFLPARMLQRSGVTPPPTIGPVQIVAMLVVVAALAVSVWAVVAFALEGKGTPAPFDPPRRLVARGPYAIVRNPMYVAATAALLAAALYYRSPMLLGYAAIFFVAVALFAVAYEEPTLRRTFGADYEAYCRRVHRWWPTFRGRGDA